MKFVIFLFYFITISISAETAKKTPEVAPVNIEVKELQKEILKLKYQKSELISLFQFSVGSIITILVLFLGGSAFANYRLSTKETENINSAIKLGLKENKLEFQDITFSKFESISKNSLENIDLINKRFEKLASDLNSSIKTDNIKLVDDFKNTLDVFNSNYRQQISMLENSFSSQINQLEKSIQKTENILNEKILDFNKLNSEKLKLSRDDLVKKIKVSELKTSRVEGYLWDSRGVHINSIRAFLEECQGHAEHNNERMVRLCLRNIDPILDKMTSLSEEQGKELIAALNIIAKKFPENVKPFFSKIESMQNKS